MEVLHLIEFAAFRADYLNYHDVSTTEKVGALVGRRGFAPFAAYRRMEG